MLAYEFLRESDPARAAKFLREWHFNPDQPRDWRGRWTKGGSLAASGGDDDYDDGPDARSPGNPKNIPDDPESSLPQDFLGPVYPIVPDFPLVAPGTSPVPNLAWFPRTFDPEASTWPANSA